ncbi:MAG: SMC family ATPase, partial [Fusobacterium sp.]|nr:SMC family ATPase [Fusobacterium sp.]
MIIKKIRLENYRSHKNTEIELSSGINLILGENGKGKSSILEAVSRLIFNISDRTGLKIGKDFIKYGENSAKVEIEFVANDGREYLLKNTFYLKKTGQNILKDLKMDEEIKDRDEVREKLNELCGIKKEYTEVYENIIIAKQNEFINIFKEKAKTREQVFNKIFNTEIYTDMYSSFFKNIEDMYSRDKTEIVAEQNIISSNMKDENEILENLNSAKFEEEKYLIELKNLKIEQEKVEKEISFYQDNERKLENILKEIQTKKNFEQDLKSNLKKEIFRTKQAKKASKLVEETKESYNKYLNFSNELEKLKKEVEILNKIEKKNIELREKNKKISWELTQNTKQIEDMEIEVLKLRNIKEDSEKSILRLEIKEKEINAELEKLRTLYSDLKSYEEIKIKFEEKEKRIKAIDREKNIVLLEKINEKKEKLKIEHGEFLILEERIRTLDEAQKKLQEKVCPFLVEECENIKDKNIDNYFLERILEEKRKKDILRENIKKIEQDISIEENLKLSLDNTSEEFNFINSVFNNFIQELHESFLSYNEQIIVPLKSFIQSFQFATSNCLNSFNQIKIKLIESKQKVSKAKEEYYKCVLSNKNSNNFKDDKKELLKAKIDNCAQ